MSLLLPSLSILNVGRGWIAVDKPSGLSVHNDPQGRADALSIVQEMIDVDDELRAACAWTKTSRLSPAHRLDRETSGVLVLATDRDSASRLQQTFEKRSQGMLKRYRAIVRGRLQSSSSGSGEGTRIGSGSETSGTEAASEDAMAGEWTWPLSDRAEGRRNPAGIAKDRKTCRTHYRIARGNDFFTELEIDLLTGRQHQIRRHAALAGHAVAGDERYGDPRHLRTMERLFGINRLMLHAERLVVPLSDREGDLLDVTAPLPAEFARLFLPPATSPQAGESEPQSD